MTEYRVKWRRQGLRPRTKIYQSFEAARRWVLILQGDLAGATGLDPDEPACCSGRDCGCGGLTRAQAWREQHAKLPALDGVIELEARSVGEWERKDRFAA